MGGLVIKKVCSHLIYRPGHNGGMASLTIIQAYLLARRDPMYQEVAERIHSLYFLATPHRGADSSSFVAAYLSMSLNTGQKAFVKELVPGNGTLQASAI